MSELSLLFLTLALSKLRIWPWKAAGLLRAATQNVFLFVRLRQSDWFLIAPLTIRRY